MKDKIIYSESYKGNGVQMTQDNLPILKHINKGISCVDAYMTAGGVIMRGEERLEYHDIRVFLKTTELNDLDIKV